ncbi:MAG TPA: hypothetical protein VFL71_04665 [Actinomycetes bacterium]|nr:hypothetical protein [Actinomycetes bacterium]
MVRFRSHGRRRGRCPHPAPAATAGPPPPGGAAGWRRTARRHAGGTW